MNETMTYVPSRLTSAKTNKVVAGANEILDDNINLKQDVINTLSKKVIDLNSVPTSSTLTYTVDSVTCNFKVGDEVRVADQESETGYTFYKLYELTTEGGVTTATWDKLGAGGGSVNTNETVNISLTQVGGNSTDLIGASVTITDDDSGDTLLTATWNGSTITTEIDTNINYTVSVETITGYLACADQSYTAGYQTERYISFQYRAYGAYIEAIDGSLYTPEQWSSAGKTVNSIVLITETFKCRIPTTHSEVVYGFADYSTPGTQYNSRPIYTNSNALTDYNGKANTDALISLDSSANRIQMIAKSYVFPAGQMSYLPACGELHEVMLNTTIINTCITAVGGNIIRLASGRGFFSSTRGENDPNTKDAGEYIRRFYNINIDGGYSPYWVYYGYQCLPIGSYV